MQVRMLTSWRKQKKRHDHQQERWEQTNPSNKKAQQLVEPCGSIRKEHNFSNILQHEHISTHFLFFGAAFRLVGGGTQSTTPRDADSTNAATQTRWQADAEAGRNTREEMPRGCAVGILCDATRREPASRDAIADASTRAQKAHRTAG